MDEQTVECPHCKGEATVKVVRHGSFSMKNFRCHDCEAEHSLEVQDKKQRREVQKLTRLKEYAGLTGSMTECTFDSYQCSNDGQRWALAGAMEFYDRIRGGLNAWLALVGKTGTGKTHLALAVANALIEDGLYTVRYEKLIRLMRRIRATYGKDNPETEQQVIAALDNCDLLILDEFGIREHMSDWERATLDDLIDHRWEQRLPLIITSNLSANEVMALAGERIESRFAQFGQVVRFTWDDYRMKGANSGR